MNDLIASFPSHSTFSRAQIGQPSQDAPLDDPDDRREHEHEGDDEDDADPDAVDVERTRRVQDVEAQTCPGGDELADQRADHREDDAGDDGAAARAHDARLMDEVRLDLLHAGKYRIEHQEEDHRYDDGHLRLRSDAERDDDDRRDRDLRDRAEDEDVGFDEPRQSWTESEPEPGRAAGDRAQDISEHDLPEGDRRVGPDARLDDLFAEMAEDRARLSDEARIEQEQGAEFPGAQDDDGGQQRLKHPHLFVSS